jgi:sulfate adenylyltransferase subunit 1 (EFTu-like GTPase family)
VLTQTRRHSFLVSLIGIRKVVLAINKMDLVDYSEKVFNEDQRGVPRVRQADRAWPTSPRSRCPA